MKHASLRGLLSLYLREFRVRAEACLCPSEWLCDRRGAGIAELTRWHVQSGWLDSSGMWAVKVKLLSSLSASSPSLAAEGESAPALSAHFLAKMRCQY